MTRGERNSKNPDREGERAGAGAFASKQRNPTARMSPFVCFRWAERPSDVSNLFSREHAREKTAAFSWSCGAQKHRSSYRSPETKARVSTTRTWACNHYLSDEQTLKRHSGTDGAGTTTSATMRSTAAHDADRKIGAAPGCFAVHRKLRAQSVPATAVLQQFFCARLAC